MGLIQTSPFDAVRCVWNNRNITKSRICIEFKALQLRVSHRISLFLNINKIPIYFLLGEPPRIQELCFEEILRIKYSELPPHGES